MSFDYIRKLVSGHKARFVDSENAVDLDLVYVTDRIIIMGYPAVGVSALYRNRRRDVLKFINERHGDKWWIWNLCPLYENAYSPESMHNRVSRYPFPDHHPPPLPLLPLAVKEITAWLDSDLERVAIIHCKAGKGRSGTLLCSYLLSLPKLPPPPQVDRNYTEKELRQRLKTRDAGEDAWVLIGAAQSVAEVSISPHNIPDNHDYDPVLHVPRSTNSSTTTISRPSPPASVSLEISPKVLPLDVGDEAHPSAPGQTDRLNGKVDEVFRLHSSRRMKPTSSGRGVSIPSQRRWCRYVNLLFSHDAPPSYLSPGQDRIQLHSVSIALHPLTGWQRPVSLLAGKAWASVARYDDEYVTQLRTRGATDGVSWGGVGGDGIFDTTKMFRSCGKMVEGHDAVGVVETDGEMTHWHRLDPVVPDGSDSIILEKDREFRLKLHLGSLPLGWLWIIPAFHLSDRAGIQTVTFVRSQVDFPLGPGRTINKVVVQLSNVSKNDPRQTTRLMTDTEEEETGFEDRKGESVQEEG